MNDNSIEFPFDSTIEGDAAITLVESTLAIHDAAALTDGYTMSALHRCNALKVDALVALVLRLHLAWAWCLTSASMRDGNEPLAWVTPDNAMDADTLMMCAVVALDDPAEWARTQARIKPLLRKCRTEWGNAVTQCAQKLKRERKQLAQREASERAQRMAQARSESHEAEHAEREAHRIDTIAQHPWKESHYQTFVRDGVRYEMEPGRIEAHFPPRGNNDAEVVTLAGFSVGRLVDVHEITPSGVVHRFELDVLVDGSLVSSTVHITAEEFAGGRWPERTMGSVYVTPARNGREHLRAAITCLAMTEHQRVYSTTGWHEHEGRWIYVHGGGAIGDDHCRARLPERLAPMVLSTVDPSKVKQSLQAIADLFMLHPSITIPLMCAVMRAPLGPTRTTVYFAGRPGSGKTTLAALAQSCFGSGWNAERLPADWNADTSNFLGQLVAQAGDMVCVIDDYTISATGEESARKKADALIRAQYNRSSPGRMSRSRDLREAVPPRGLIVATGEMLPPGESLRSRVVVLELHTRIEAEIAPYVRMASQGVYAHAMAAFIEWLQPQYGSVRGALERKEREALKTLGVINSRTGALLASLLVGYRAWVAFARTHGVSMGEETTVVSALHAHAHATREAVEQERPELRWTELLWAALASGVAHLCNRQNKPPENAEKYGWKQSYNGHDPCGDMIGFIDEKSMDVWLFPEPSHGAVCQMARKINEPFPLNHRDVFARMRETKLLKRHEGETYTARIKVKGEVYRCVVLEREAGVPPMTEMDVSQLPRDG